MRYIVVHFWSKIILFVCLPQQRIVHMNKKVVGGNYYVLVYYKNASAPDPEDAIVHFFPVKRCVTYFILVFFLSGALKYYYHYIPRRQCARPVRSGGEYCTYASIHRFLTILTVLAY
jgi:hypothetical protein